MPHTRRKRYAVVSCHVERPLDDEVWSRFSSLQARRPGGLAIAALLRPPDPAFGEDESVWVERAREAAARGPLGQHTHWTAPEHARPTGGDPGARVAEEGRRFRELGLEPTLFCGGGWYTDSGVAEACAELGYVDCTPRARRPGYLAEGERWASLAAPGRVALPSGRELLAVPTTHSLGELARAPLMLPEITHVYFHDTDLLSARRRGLLQTLFVALARRTIATDLDVIARVYGPKAPAIPWDDVTRL